MKFAGPCPDPLGPGQGQPQGQRAVALPLDSVLLLLSSLSSPLLHYHCRRFRPHYYHHFCSCTSVTTLLLSPSLSSLHSHYRRCFRTHYHSTFITLIACVIACITYSALHAHLYTCLSGPLNGMYKSHPLSSSHLPLIAPVASKACILSHIDQWPHPMAQYHFDNFTSVLLASLYYIGSCELGGLSK